MKFAQISRYGAKIVINSAQIPQLQPNQLLIKMHYAPINPSDIYYIKGLYGIRK